MCGEELKELLTVFAAAGIVTITVVGFLLRSMGRMQRRFDKLNSQRESDVNKISDLNSDIAMLKADNLNLRGKIELLETQAQRDAYTIGTLRLRDNSQRFWQLTTAVSSIALIFKEEITREFRRRL